jgi:homoserine dehydrogenase
MSRENGSGTFSERTKFSWPIVLALVAGTALLYTKLGNIGDNVADLKTNMAETYETKADHAADIEKISSSNQKLWQGEQALSSQVQQNHEQTQVSIQELTDAVNNNKPNK